MLCEKCGKNEANVKIVQIENDKKTELHLCQECAQGHPGFSLGFDLGNILSSMFQHGGLAGKIGRAKSLKQCSTCGFTLGDIQKTGRLGCGACYGVFQEELDPVLRRLHGSINHTGKVPARTHPKARMGREIETFQKRLEECIRVEDYEQAAVYRDEIRRLQTELGEEGQANGEK